MQTYDDLGSVIRKAIYKGSVKASIFNYPSVAISRSRLKCFAFVLSV